jgi:hypothetical protein
MFFAEKGFLNLDHFLEVILCFLELSLLEK